MEKGIFSINDRLRDGCVCDSIFPEVVNPLFLVTVSMHESKTHFRLGRVLLTLSFVGLLAAWWTQASGGTFLGQSPEHFFSDAIVLALLGIGILLDGIVHKLIDE